MMYPVSMDASAKPPKPMPAGDPRAERLAAALRENLKRRKAQLRAKEQTKKPAAKD
jgi:hypothetical protein